MYETGTPFPTFFRFLPYPYDFSRLFLHFATFSVKTLFRSPPRLGHAVQQMADTIVCRDLPPLALRAAFMPATVNAEKRTVDVTWSTGARVLRRFDAALDIWTKFWEELALETRAVRLGRLNNGAPLLDGHPLFYFGDPRAANVRGIVVPGSARVNGREGTATVRFARADDDPDADKLWRKVQDGIVVNVSVGYRVYRAEKQTVEIDAIPVYLVTDWEPFEISTVSAGDDDGAGFRSAETVRLNPCSFVMRSVADADRDRRFRLAQAQLSQ